MTIIRDKEEYYIIIKGTFQQENRSYKYLCTKEGNTQIYKTVTKELIIIGGFKNTIYSNGQII